MPETANVRAARPRRLAGLVAVCALVAGCTGADDNASSTPTPARASASAAAAEQRLADFDGLVTALERMHPDPFGAVDEHTWRATVADLRARVPDMTADQFLAAAATVSNLGDRSGHGGVFPTDQQELAAWPLRLYELPDGWRIVAATDRSLVGARLDRIGGRPVSQVADAVAPLVPRDNPQSLQSRLGLYLVVPGVLRGLDQLGDGTLTVTGADGTRTIPAPATVGRDEFIALTGTTVPQIPPALPLRPARSPDDYFWSQRRGDALVVGYERVLARTPDGRFVEDFLATLRADVARSRPRLVVVDVRRNPGGENEQGEPFTAWLREVATAGIPVRVLISRATYSATAVLFAELDGQAELTFYGEPSGGGSGTFGNPRPYRLSSSGIVVQVPTRWFSRVTRDVPALEPDVPVTTTWADYAAGRDAVLAAALS